MAYFDKCYKIEDFRKILNERVRGYEEKFGHPDKILETFYNTHKEGCWDLINECRIYVKAKRIITITHDELHVIPFSKIIGYELIDVNADYHAPIESATTTVTKTDTGNMLKRAVIGGVVAGGVGAAIGAATAKKTGTQKMSEVEEYSNYYRAYSGSSAYYALTININDIVSPTIKIKFDDYLDNAKEFAASLNAIIKQNAEIETSDDSVVVSESSELVSTGKTIGIEPTNLDEIRRRERERDLAEEKDRKRDETLYEFLFGIVFALIFLLMVYKCS